MYPFAPPEPYLLRGYTASLAEHLGYSARDRLLIINADDFGLSQSVNEAVEELFHLKKTTSTTIMVTALMYEDALQRYREGRFPCGVHVSLTGDYADDGSRPVLPSAQVPSLVASTGRLHPDREHFFRNATPRDAYVEAKAQIDRALKDGIDVTHIDSHEGTLQLRPQFAEVYIRLAAEYALPVRSGSRAFLEQMGMEESWVDRLRENGICSPDNLIYFPIDHFESYTHKEKVLLEVLGQIPTGVTEVYFHPTMSEGPTTGQGGVGWRHVREWDYRLLLSDGLQQLLTELQVKLVDFRAIREVMRGHKTEPAC